MRRMGPLLAVVWLFSSYIPSLQQNNNAVSSGEFIVEPPILINLGFEWKIKLEIGQPTPIYGPRR